MTPALILPRPNRIQGLSGILQISLFLTLQPLRRLTSLQSWLLNFHTNSKLLSFSGLQRGAPTAARMLNSYIRNLRRLTLPMKVLQKTDAGRFFQGLPQNGI